MLVSLPVAGYCFLLLAFVMRRNDRRSAALHAATAWGVLVVAITETLSLFGWLTRMSLGVAWLIVDAAALVSVAPLVGKAERGPTTAARGSGLAALARLGTADLALTIGCSTVVGLVGVVALLSPPNSWDAMQYHVPRVVHWIQNRSVAFYPTYELKQLYMPPGAEFLTLQFHALSGGDRFDNLVQWFAYLGSVVGVTVIARLLGAGLRGQVLAAVVCATIPEGILGASGAKNDYVLSFWLVALAYYALSFRENPSRLRAIGIGATLGLAWLTKGTAYAFAAPILVTLVVFWPAKVKLALLQSIPFVVLLAVALNAGHFARNYGLYGSPVGPSVVDVAGEGTYKYTNDTISVSAVLSNVLRNAVLHVRSEHRARNAVIEDWLGRVIRRLGADPDDPRTNFFSFMKFRLPEVQMREGFAGNPLHLVLVAVTLLILCFRGYRPDQRTAAEYSLSLVVSFIAFCALYKWQPLNARLHLPLFVLSSAGVGMMIGTAWPTVVARGLAAVLLFASVPFVMGNEARSLAPGHEFTVLAADRTHLYFGDHRDVAESYVAASRFVGETGCRSVGLDLSAGVGAQYEYPLLALLGAQDGRGNVRLIGVNNPSTMYDRSAAAFKPCAVVCVRCSQLKQKWERYGAHDENAAVFGDIVVFVSKDKLRERVLPPGVPPRSLAGQSPVAKLTVTDTRARSGDHLVVGLEVRNPRGNVAAELYVGIILPGGRSARFVSNSGGLSPAMPLSEPAAFPFARAAPPGFSLDDRSFLDFVPGCSRKGTYRVFAALVREGSFRASGGSLREDVLALDMRDLVVIP